MVRAQHHGLRNEARDHYVEFQMLSEGVVDVLKAYMVRATWPRASSSAVRADQAHHRRVTASVLLRACS